MNDEDFVMGYAVGYNDGVGSGGGGSGGIIINEGTSIYDVPILHNYSFVGTDFGLATFDVNECAFMNISLSLSYNNAPQYYTNPITKEIVTYTKSPRGMNRIIGFALTKGGKVIDILKATAAKPFIVFSDKSTYEYIENGSLYPKKDIIKTEKIENPVITSSETPLGDEKQLHVYIEYDVVTETIQYSKPPETYYNSEYGFRHYLKSDLDAQEVASTTISTSHEKAELFSAKAVTTILEGETYPEEWLNKYILKSLGGQLFGISIMDDYELSTSLFDGIA